MTQKEVEDFKTINNHRRNGKCSQKSPSKEEPVPDGLLCFIKI